MTSIALLMIEQSYEETTLEPLIISGESILYHQIIQLHNLGISRFIVAVEKIDSKLLNIATNLRREGIEIEFLSRLSALSDMIGRDDIFLMISDGIWSSDKHIEDMINANTSEILAFKNDEKLSDFELIDLNYRWSGLARLSGEILSSTENLPEDSAVQSTLLRLALQQGYALKVIECSQASLSKITDQAAADNITKDQIEMSQARMNIRGLFETLLYTPIANFLMPKLWKECETRPAIGHAIEYSYLLFFALAIIFAIFNLEIISFTLAVAACFCWFIRDVQYNIKLSKDSFPAIMIGNINIFIILIIMAYHWQDLLGFAAAIIIFFLGFSSKRLNFQRHYDRLIFSFSDIFFIMIVANFYSVQIYVMVIISILYALWIFGGTILLKPEPKR